MKFILRLIGWLFLALSLLGLGLAFVGELEYEFSMATALISIAFFSSALYEERKPKLRTYKGSTLTEKK
jgi:hypothetical protein